jgi:ABC-type glycerol-3-phosphate transport system permease component
MKAKNRAISENGIHAPRPQGHPRPVRAGRRGQWEVVLAASVIATVPMLIIFFLGQRYFVEGIATIGRKG